MKASYLYMLIVIVGGLFSCNRDDNFTYPTGMVGSSKIVYFPSIKINGDKLIILHKGDTYTEPGAVAILNGASVQYTTTGTVDTNTGDVYDLVYTASNPQGYTASDWRTVVVIDDANVAANDFSGTYQKTSPSVGKTSTWTKTAPGMYTVENPGGSAGVGLTVLAVNCSGNKIKIPHYISADFGEVSSASETYFPSLTPIEYSWIFNAGGYGAYLRTFTKQ